MSNLSMRDVRRDCQAASEAASAVAQAALGSGPRRLDTVGDLAAVVNALDPAMPLLVDQVPQAAADLRPTGDPCVVVADVASIVAEPFNDHSSGVHRLRPALKLGVRLLPDRHSEIPAETEVYQSIDCAAEALDAGEVPDYLGAVAAVLAQVAQGLGEEAPGWLEPGSELVERLAGEAATLRAVAGLLANELAQAAVAEMDRAELAAFP